MISIDLIRNEPELVREAMRKRNEDVPIDRVLALDSRRRAAISESDSLRARRNEVSKELGQMQNRPQVLIEEMRGVGEKIRKFDEELRAVEEELHTLLLTIPNLLADDVPLGEDESGNLVVQTVGEIPSFTFQPQAHWDLGPQLDIIDFERGAKISGSRFYVLKGKAARLQRALITWMIDLHTQEHGYQEVYLPALVSRATAIGSSQLPKFSNTMYHDDEHDLWLVPTAEMPITSLHRDEILEPGTLPIYYVAHSPCFRDERAAAGRDTRGIKRVHQFEKVEMYKFVEPDSSAAELDKLLADAEDVCARLEIPYRVLELCTGDLGFSAVKSYDLEMWAPGSNEWLEVSSCSNCADFQARRASIRYRPERGARPQFPHTLNGSGLALPRVIIAILENYQQPDGSVIIPQVLRPYTGFDKID